MSTIPNNLLEIANDAWLTLPYGVRDILKQSNWVAGFCEGYKTQLATDGREELEKDCESWQNSAITWEAKFNGLQSSLKEKEKECIQQQEAIDRAAIILEELKAENERLKLQNEAKQSLIDKYVKG